MRLFLLCTLTMIAFAANSVLNRLALADGAMGPSGFAAIRLVSGAAVLVGLSVLTRGGVGWRRRGRLAGTLSLALYVIGFSFAYVSLPSGVGALVLFGGVQVTMFAGALMMGEAVPARRWLGAAMGFAGLLYLLWPGGGTAPALAGCVLMGAAALGWGTYSLLGRTADDPLQSTAANFALAAPLGLIVFAVLPDGVTARGVALAAVSGGLTSGLGYALWYAILPRLGAARAAVAQLTVPVIALAAGMAFLDEVLTPRFVIAALLVLGGVAISLTGGRRA